MLELRKVWFEYTRGQPVVRDLSLTVRQGEFVAVAGRNGSGKTTLTRLIMALIKPTAGQILFDGQDMNKCRPADMARHVGYVFQNPDRQIFRDTVRAEVAYGPEQLGFAADEVQKRVAQALAVTGLEELASVYPRTLAKGQKQRVAIASALAIKPRMLILDEPTSGQDASERERLLELLATLNKRGMTIILITHDMDILTRFVQRVIVMSKGSKVYDGAVAELFSGAFPIYEWGLTVPAAVKVAQGLTNFGIPLVLEVEDLCSFICKAVRGEENA